MSLKARALTIAGRAAVVMLLTSALLPARSGAQPTTMSKASGDSARIELSGTLFTNFQYGGAADSRAANRFELERAYLTARARLSQRATVRLTADVFQQRDDSRDDFYGGWAFRAKYAYLQYESSARAGVRASGRIGMLPTVIIDQEEVFWPRWISNVALERAGFFSSADVGIAGSVALPAKMGQLYGTVTNGPGYQSREADRFKDAALRLTLTPLAGSANSMLRTLAISPWIYKGARASRYADGVGSLEPISSARARDRWGVLVGSGNRILTVAAHIGQRRDETDSLVASGSGDSTIVLRETSADVVSAFAIARPFASQQSSVLRPLGIILRRDVIEDPELGAERRAVIAGLLWDAGPNLSFALDYQEQALGDRSGTARPASLAAADTRVYFVHAVVSF